MYKYTNIITVAVIFIMVAMLNLVVGCNNEKPISISGGTTSEAALQNTQQTRILSYNIDLPMATISLESATANQERKRIDIFYSYQYKNTDFVSRLLTFEQYEGISTIYEARVTDEYDKIMFSFNVYADPIDTSTIVLCEKTESDSLFINKTVIGENITERYNLNGQIFSLRFTEDEANQYLIEHSKEVNRFGSYDNDNLSYNKFNDFMEFYPEEMTLNNNIDGLIMVSLIQNDEFLIWLSDQTGLPYIENQDKLDVDGLCELANIGSAKCLLGSIANPICHVAVGVNIACGVRTVLGWFD